MLVNDFGAVVHPEFSDTAVAAIGRALHVPSERGTVAGLGTVGMAPTGSPSLYFEVRIDGRPADPVQWLQPAPARPPA